MRRYHFKESCLKSDFAHQKVQDFTNLIETASSFCVLSIPGVGVTNFLRFFVSTCPHYHFLLVDSFSLAKASKLEFYRQILKEAGAHSQAQDEQQLLDLCRVQLAKLCQSGKKVVVILNRFNRLVDIFDPNLFANLRWLQIPNQDRVILICTSPQPLYQINPRSITGSNLGLFSKIYYFTPYSPTDLRILTAAGYKNPDVSAPQLNYLISRSGGHLQLLQLLLKAEPKSHSFLDPFVKLQLQAILSHLNPADTRSLKKIATGKSLNQVDPYLEQIGLVKKSAAGYSPFSPLMTEYLQTSVTKLPAKESKLFHILKQNIGQVVPTSQILEAIWPDNWENTSDWALNALIYRLRNHLVFENSGFSITSHKKLGYQLTSP